MNALFYNLEPGCYIMLISKFISDPLTLYMNIHSTIEFKNQFIKTNNNMILVPYQTSYYSNTLESYKYLGIDYNPGEMPHFIESLCTDFCEISKLLVYPAENKIEYKLPNSCIINYYRNGNDYTNWNSFENIKHPIYTISLGAERIIQLRKKNNNDSQTFDIKLSDGSLLIMYGDIQSKYEHKIPKTQDNSGQLALSFIHNGL